MAVTFTREFYINFGLFLFVCLALGLSIWAFATPCKKDGFGDSNHFKNANMSTISFDTTCSFSTNKQCSYNQYGKSWMCPGGTVLTPKYTNTCTSAVGTPEWLHVERGGHDVSNGQIQCATSKRWDIESKTITCPS